LRDGGMSISDRRAVRLQRVVAASAIISGRSEAIASDIWPLRMIWDTPAQIETLASHVQSVIENYNPASTTSDLREHPLARPEHGPDPELLAQSIQNLRDKLNEPSAADTLSLLAARVEWVRNDAARDDLRERIEGTRKLLIPK